MTLLLGKLGFGRRWGLAARAALFAAALIAATTAAMAVTVLLAADREGARYQLRAIADLTAPFAAVAGDLILAGDLTKLDQAIAEAASRAGVRGASVRDASGRVLSEAGRGGLDAATMDRLARDVAAANQAGHMRGADGRLAFGVPIMRDGRLIGVAAIMWEADAYRPSSAFWLGPFLLLAFGLMALAIPLTARAMRGALAPLDQFARFLRTMDEGAAVPLELRSDDQLATLAKALNEVASRFARSAQHVQQSASVDPVTHLPNQEQFIREINRQNLQAPGGRGGGAVAVFEMQRLPKLVRTLDPVAERELLRLIAARLRSAALAYGATAIAARLGAAEFAAFALGPKTQADAARFAHHINASLRQPLEWRGHKLALGVCCGVALTPRDAEAAIKRARTALAAAQTIPGQLQVFTPALDREAVARLTLEREMREALERGEFRAHFQPKINLTTGRVEACEALARWARSDNVIVSPGRFIPVAEESGLIGPLSEAITREACWKTAAWARAGHPVSVAVNVSALQFRDERFAERVFATLDQADLAPALLELEITESVVMEDPDRALHTMRALRETGVRLAIDDFGCGHSNLAALSKLPFNVIKIDQQFIRGLARGDPQAPAIIDMILALARAMEMEVVAEGIERQNEANFMTARGCRWAQGFLYGAAMPAPEFAELLQRQNDRTGANAA